MKYILMDSIRQKGSVHFFVVVGVLTGVTLLLFAGTILKPVWEQEDVRKPLETAKKEIKEQASSALSFVELAPQIFSDNPPSPLRGEEGGRVNVLILGIGGEGHIGELLTDTIMFASFSVADLRADVFSVPRDLAVAVPGRSTFAKINALYALSGEAAFPNPGGIELTRQAVEKVTGFPIHYYVIVDFQALVKVIDLVGGIFVPQDETLTDVRFPTNDFGTQTFEVPAGWRYLNGEDALRYVRSRKSTSDFDRMRRQHIVLLSLAQKIRGLDATRDFPVILGLYEAAQHHIATDGGLQDVERIWELTEGFTKGATQFHVISSEPGNLLVSRMVEWSGQQAYILQPKAGAEEYGEIQGFIREKIINL